MPGTCGRPTHAGERLGLSEDELAFYDALETNDSAVQVLGDETLRAIAQELVRTVRSNVTIDWTLRENVRAQLRVLVRRILRKHGYPPDKQEKATVTVLGASRGACPKAGGRPLKASSFNPAEVVGGVLVGVEIARPDLLRLGQRPGADALLPQLAQPGCVAGSCQA